MSEDKKLFIETYGCQMNVADSEVVASIMATCGYMLCDDINDADAVFLNTCSIRDNAEQKVLGRLQFMNSLRHKKGKLIVGVIGCMAERVKEDLINNYGVDLVAGPDAYNDLPNLVGAVECGEKAINIELSTVETYKDILPRKIGKSISGFISIMRGCNNFCSYCIVPYTRGRERSRPPQSILNELNELKNNGIKEITLLGQNVNAYGKDLEVPEDFASLLTSVAETGIERVRFVTSHPWDFTDEMIDVIAKYDNIMPYIHLPLQSGSTNILKLMGRRYSKEEYLELFNKIRTRVKNATITTDIIVGFPNESEEDFNETLDVVDKCQFDGAFTFIYSPREGTPASKIKDSITLEEKEKRLQILNKKINNYSLQSNKKFLDKIVKVLVLGINEKDENKVYGYTEEMKLVNIEAPRDTIGQIIDVKIDDAKSFSLDGHIEK